LAFIWLLPRLWRILLYLFVHPHQPMLIVNSEGIQTHGTSGDFFIRWPEIEGIFVHAYQGRRYLGIRPKNLKQYLSRFSPLKRLWIYYFVALEYFPLMHVQLMYLDISIPEFFHQLSQCYASELCENSIWLMP
jgi:hypothetical protein